MGARVVTFWLGTEQQHPQQMKSKFLPVDKCNKQRHIVKILWIEWIRQRPVVDQNAVCNMKGVAHSDSHTASSF